MVKCKFELVLTSYEMQALITLLDNVSVKDYNPRFTVTDDLREKLLLELINSFSIETGLLPVLRKEKTLNN